MKDIKLIVATHKKYEMPKDDMYIPLYVGSKGKDSIGFERDDNGINISEKNPFFCELTGLYWAWKNLNDDYIGLCHYRRHFTLNKRIPKREEDKFKNLLTKEQVDKILENTDIILPKERNYYIENLYDHYKHTMYVEPLDETGKIAANITKRSRINPVLSAKDSLDEAVALVDGLNSADELDYLIGTGYGRNEKRIIR